MGMAVMLRRIGGPLLINLDPDGCETYTDRDTPSLATTFGIASQGRGGNVSDIQEMDVAGSEKKVLVVNVGLPAVT